jgi:hypothetical protein
VVKGQGRTQTEHSRWDALRDFGERVVFGLDSVGNDIEPALDPLQAPRQDEPTEMFAGNTRGGQISGTEYPKLASQAEEFIASTGEREKGHR